MNDKEFKRRTDKIGQGIAELEAKDKALSKRLSDLEERVNEFLRRRFLLRPWQAADFFWEPKLVYAGIPRKRRGRPSKRPSKPPVLRLMVR